MHTKVIKLVGRILRKDKSSVPQQPSSSKSSPSFPSSPSSSPSLPDPVQNLRDRLSLESIKQFYMMVGREERKCGALCELYDSGMVPITRTVIFCNARWKVDWFTEEMRSRGFTVSAMHEGMGIQNAVSLEEFHSGSSSVLITTDLLALEINVKVPLIISCDLPTIGENYIRRIGLLGPKGVAINFVATEEVQLLRRIRLFLRIHIQEMPLHVAPNGIASAFPSDFIQAL